MVLFKLEENRLVLMPLFLGAVTRGCAGSCHALTESRVPGAIEAL